MRKPTPLKLAIVASGIPQHVIAKQVGLDTATMSRIVNGLHADDATRQKVADALDTSVSALWPEPTQAAA